jgi:capsule biosynthesis phosphatase
MKKLVLDLDKTLTAAGEGQKGDYLNVLPCHEVIEKVRAYKKDGFQIAIYTARNMQTYQNSIGRINALTLPTIIEWLEKHDVPYDEIHVGKPWCGEDGFYVDDKAIRPSEFTRLSHDEIRKLIDAEGKK